MLWFLDPMREFCHLSTYLLTYFVGSGIQFQLVCVVDVRSSVAVMHVVNCLYGAGHICLFHAVFGAACLHFLRFADQNV